MAGNQYLWPMLMTTDEGFYTLMRGIKQILQVWVGSQIPITTKPLPWPCSHCCRRHRGGGVPELVHQGLTESDK